jgi:hypothetical protein
MPRTLAEIRSEQAVNEFVDLVDELEGALRSSKDAMASRLCQAPVIAQMKAALAALPLEDRRTLRARVKPLALHAGTTVVELLGAEE